MADDPNKEMDQYCGGLHTRIRIYEDDAVLAEFGRSPTNTWILLLLKQSGLRVAMPRGVVMRWLHVGLDGDAELLGDCGPSDPSGKAAFGL